jgi:hypothetical protein
LYLPVVVSYDIPILIFKRQSSSAFQQLPQQRENNGTISRRLQDAGAGIEWYLRGSLASQISKNNPTRKAELVAHITSVVFKNIDSILADFDAMAINALAEAVHNWNGSFKSKQFYAKYNSLPQAESKGTKGRYAPAVPVFY